MADLSDDLEKFKNFYMQINELMADSSKEDLAECARLLAFNLALYKQQFGQLPKKCYEKMLTIESVDDATGAVLASGILELGIMLAQVTDRRDEIAKLKALRGASG
ncbi:MAG: hypothetical protein L0Z68_06995 [Gammaproteobacteria bacterium]|nr:hypothetical protein [Gammaproteobacteria bacterium]